MSYVTKKKLVGKHVIRFKKTNTANLGLFQKHPCYSQKLFIILTALVHNKAGCRTSNLVYEVWGMFWAHTN